MFCDGCVGVSSHSVCVLFVFCVRVVVFGGVWLLLVLLAGWGCGGFGAGGIPNRICVLIWFGLCVWHVLVVCRWCG